jgi:hypothetical protein
MAKTSMSTAREHIRAVPAMLLCATVAFVFVASARAQEPAPKKKRTIYVPPQTGSLLGGGYVDSGETETAPGTAASSVAVSKKPAFRAALANFDSQSTTMANGYALTIPAVSWQTKVPVDIIKKQRAATRMTFGELLVANSLASGSGRSFNEIVALQAKTKSWEQVAKQLRVNIDSVTARLKSAADSIKYAEGRKDKEREQNLHETMSHTLPTKNAAALGAGGG